MLLVEWSSAQCWSSHRRRSQPGGAAHPHTIPRERETEPDPPHPEDEMRDVVGSIHGHEVGRRSLADDEPIQEQPEVDRATKQPGNCGLALRRRAIAKAAIPNNRCTTLCRIDTTLWVCGYLPRLVSFFDMPASTATGRCCSPA